MARIDDRTNRQQRSHRHATSMVERGASTIEYVGVVVAAATLMVAIGAGMHPGGVVLGTHAASTLRELVGGRSTPDAEALRARIPRARGRWRDQHERRTGGGAEPVRVSRDEIRIDPVIDPIAWWSTRGHAQGELGGGVRGTIGASACVLCVGAELSHDLQAGSTTGTSKPRANGFTASAEGSARVALASGQIDARLERPFAGNAGQAATAGRVRATIGAEADGDVELHAGVDELDVQAEAGAMVGAAARAEARVGIDLLGIAIEQSGRAEGWAGAGIRGSAGVKFGNGSVAWKLGWGGALGFGGAAEWSGSIDVKDAVEGHRRLARDALRVGLLATRPPWRRDD